MSKRDGSLQSASDAVTPDAAAVARFAADLARLIDIGRDRVLVAVSGGADSIALLLLTRAVLGSKCVAATVDHGLRPESADEARFVACLCDRLDIGHATLAGPLPPRAGRTANLSARARVLRYGLLEAHLAQVGAQWLATAHHADDQIETMVMRLNRGAGIAGLAGIRPSGGRIVRPLLGWRRAELAAIVAQAGVAPVDDPSNADDRYDRARLRKALAGAGWIDGDHWTRSAQALGDAEAALAWMTRELAERCCVVDGDTITLHLGDHPIEIVRRLVIQCLMHVDPAIDPRGDAVMRLVATILATERHSLGRHSRAMLGNVSVETHFHREMGLTASFSPAPPRRSD